jgi:AcrR family transcriptional regulator
MEKTTRERLLDAGLELLGTAGARHCTARAAEDAAGMPHGSVRHHFGNHAGFLAALVDHLYTLDSPAAGETLADTIGRWLGSDRARTRARYELALLATREPGFREPFVAGRERYVATLAATGLPHDVAARAVAMVDGLVLDAMIRGLDHLDLEAAEHLLHTPRT